MAKEKKAGPVADRLFEMVIQKTLRELPGNLKNALKTVQILVQDKPEGRHHGRTSSKADNDLFGIFEGFSLKERPLGTDRYFPDRIILYKESLERNFPDKKDLAREIRTTLIHELGHYFGFNENELRKRGWD